VDVCYHSCKTCCRRWNYIGWDHVKWWSRPKIRKYGRAQSFRLGDGITQISLLVIKDKIMCNNDLEVEDENIMENDQDVKKK